MKFEVAAFVLLRLATTWQSISAFTPSSHFARHSVCARMAGGEGGESEWVKALMENSPPLPGEFENKMKMKGLLGKKGSGNQKLSANAELVAWLEEEGGVYLSEESSWAEAPHPMAISTDTKDEITNESSGRGLLARRDINGGDNLFKIPLKLCLTKESAREALGKDTLPDGTNEYLAIACQLIHERCVMGEKSFWKPYLGVLPEVDEVNPTFTWSDEDLSYLDGSPVVAATKSLQLKLRREYDSLLGGEDGLIAKFPDRFPAEVRTKVVAVPRHLQFPCHPRGSSFLTSVHVSLLVLALHVRKLGMGIYNALFPGDSTPESQGWRRSGDGAVRRPDQSFPLFTSLHRRQRSWGLDFCEWGRRGNPLC